MAAAGERDVAFFAALEIGRMSKLDPTANGLSRLWAALRRALRKHGTSASPGRMISSGLSSQGVGMAHHCKGRGGRRGRRGCSTGGRRESASSGRAGRRSLCGGFAGRCDVGREARVLAEFSFQRPERESRNRLESLNTHGVDPLAS